jgi:tetratricopeptide (TPR) repeat protein
MKYFCLKYYVILFTISGNFIFAQNTLKEQYDYSEKLFNEEMYFDAVTELKRLNYFDSEKEYSYKSNLLIGKSYKEGGKFADALKYFTLAEISAATDSDLFIAEVYSARVNILRRTTGRALEILNELESDKKYNSRSEEIYYWKGWAYIFTGNWSEASEQFAKIDENNPLKKLCDKVESDRYNVTTAKLLSYVLPGSGQFYTGHYFSGLLSLGWNVLCGYLTVKAFVDERIFDGFIIGNFLWLRFYLGNIQNAQKFAEDENLAISNKALSYLQYKYSGEKP